MGRIFGTDSEMSEPRVSSHKCGVSRSIVSPLQAAGIWKSFLGHPPYLGSKGQRDNRMVGKQEAAEGVYAADLQDPRTMASAALREVVRRITRPVYLFHRRKELGGCSWVSELTGHRKVMGPEQARKAASTERRGRWTETARPVSYGKDQTV